MVETSSAKSIGSVDQIRVEKVHLKMTPAVEMSHKIKFKFGWLAALVATIVLWVLIIQAAAFFAG